MSGRGTRDSSEIVNCLKWAAAMTDRALPLRPDHSEREHQDRMALRREAFRIAARELLTYEYTASPSFLEGLLETEQDPGEDRRDR